MIFISFIVGIPKVYWYGEEAGCCIMVMELLNENIEEIFSRQYKRKLTLMTILLIIDQMVLFVHSLMIHIVVLIEVNS
jgi:hypothetical protein